VAVVGVGHLGRFHAQKYAALPQAELVAVVDPDPERAKAVGEEVGAPAFTRLEDVLPKVRAVSIAAPTQFHHALGMQCLSAGLHVLMEKPLAATEEEAAALVAAAHEHARVLQVGYLERFNPAFLASQPAISRPQFIEALRITPFRGRGADVDVVLDLMSHDLDLVRAMVGEEPNSLHAVGISILTKSTDLANVRLTFPGGCVANLTASRMSAKGERKMRVFQKDRYFSMDFSGPSVNAFAHVPDAGEEIPLREETMEVVPGDALQTEIGAFLNAVAGKGPPPVSGEDGLAAMVLSHRVMNDIAKNRLP